MSYVTPPAARITARKPHTVTRPPAPCPACHQREHYHVYPDRLVWACGHTHHWSAGSSARGPAPEPNPVSHNGSRTT